MLKRYLAGIGGFLIFVAVFCVAAQLRPDQMDRGGEWLSWSPRERDTFVDGFISGYRQGSQGGCDVAQELFGKPGKMYRQGDEHHPSEISSARCLALTEKYSKARYTETSGPDFSAYTDVITEFYRKHPEYQGIPFVNLLKSLSDRDYKTADQLYGMALKGELHPIR
jgi:hypothetical protein